MLTTRPRTLVTAAREGTLTLPFGNYRCRADRSLTQYWSGQINHCTVPGCYSVSVIFTGPPPISSTVHVDRDAPLSAAQSQPLPSQGAPVRTSLPIYGDPTALLLAPLAVLVMAGKRRRRS